MDKELRRYLRIDADRVGHSANATYTNTIVHPNTRTGSSNPNWRKSVSDQRFTASGYSRSSVDLEASDGHCGMSWKYLVNGVATSRSTTLRGNGGAANTLGIPATFYTTANVNEAIATADSRLHDRIRQAHTESQGIVILGELRETIRMMRSPVQGMRRILDHYARAMKRRAVDSRTARQFLIGATDQYLELVFGLRPLISDVYSLAKTAARATVETRPLTRVVASSQAPLTSSIYQSVVGPSDCLQRFTSLAKGELSVQSIAYLKQTVQGPTTSLERVLELSGFNLESFVPSVYNLIPYSFVVDYFTNLGDVLSAWTTCQSNVIGYVRTTRELTTREESYAFDFDRSKANVAGFDFVQHGADLGHLSYKRTTFNRVIGSKVPVPDLILSLPGEQQFANLAALVVGLFAGINPPRR